MELIQIENMKFYAFHGHFKEEHIVGNKFLVDLYDRNRSEKGF
jgi:7,8-dihydroneopterin aldolase/epimerase/oxygenase